MIKTRKLFKNVIVASAILLSFNSEKAFADLLLGYDFSDAVFEVTRTVIPETNGNPALIFTSTSPMPTGEGMDAGTVAAVFNQNTPAIATGINLDGVIAFSIEFCFKANNVSGFLLHIGQDLNDSIYFYLHDTLHDLVVINKLGETDNISIVRNNYALNVDQWYRVKYTVSNTREARLYINDVQVASGTGALAFAVDGDKEHDLHIGAKMDGSGFYNGMISDIQINTIDLTPIVGIIPETEVFEEDLPGYELHGTLLQLWKEDNATAVNGKVVHMKDYLNTWALQWVWPSSNFLKGIDYDVYARVSRPVGATGDAEISGGIFHRLTLGQGSTIVQYRDHLGSSWENSYIGRARLGEIAGYIYMNTVETHILLDHFYTVPVINDSNDEYYEYMMYWKSLQEAWRQSRLAQIEANIQQYTGLSQHFLYGTVCAKPGFMNIAAITGVPWEWELEQVADDIKRHYGNFCSILALDAADPYMYSTIELLDDQNIYTTAGDLKIISSIFSVGESIDEAEFHDFMQTTVASYSNNQYFLSWSLADEPLTAKYYDYMVGKDIAEDIDFIRPSIPILNTIEVLELFGPHQQVLMPDFYTMKTGFEDPWKVGDIAKICREDISDVPIWFLYSAYSNVFNGQRTMTMPGATETRLMLHRLLLENCKGMAGYIYNIGPCFDMGSSTRHPETLTDSLRTPQPAWEETGRIGKMLFPVGKILTTADRDSVPAFTVNLGTINTQGAVTRPIIETASWHRGNVVIILTVNNDIQNNRSFQLPLPAGLAAADIFAPISVTSGTQNVELEPGGAACFAYGTSVEIQALLNDIWDVRYQQQCEILKVDMKMPSYYGLIITTYIQQMEAVNPGTGMYSSLEQIRSNMLSSLWQIAPGLQQGLTTLSQCRAVLSECEERLEALALIDPALLQSLITRWYGQVLIFGPLRKAILKNEPWTQAELNTLYASSQQLLSDVMNF